MINVSAFTGRTGSPRRGNIRSTIMQVVAGATLVSAPLAPLFAESFELPGSIPSVMVEQDTLGMPTQPPADFAVGAFNDSFTSATCTDGCTSCGPGVCRCDGDPPGFFQKLCGIHDKTGACWVGRVDALVLWRNAPPNRPLFAYADPDTFEVGPTALNADQLESDPLVAPRISLLRRNGCGEAVEATYLYAGNFYSHRELPYAFNGYATAPNGIYGNVWTPPLTPLSSASATLTGNLQSLEFNRRTAIGIGATQFLFGFRWLQWYERLQMTDGYQWEENIVGQDDYLTSCTNNLFGGQIGLDGPVLTTAKGFRVEGLVKAGAYYNDASQTSSFSYVNSGGSFASGIAVQSPGGASFVGEVGLTAVVPIARRWDFRCGYFGLWLEGLAQPANQLSGQVLTQIDPPSGSLDLTGGLVVQGLSLGLEGRW